MSRFETIDSVWDFLNEIPMFQNTGLKAANFSLDNIRSFCAELGNPQDSYSSIHIGGTNGKGTTAYLLEQVYSKAGYKTGMFTSPHLLKYNERVRVQQIEISDEEILAFFRDAEKILIKIPLSYFEISTALAFWYFEKAEVDIAIVEVGLGGRLDSTNIIQPEASVITSIGLDHQDILGNTVEEIASEKAGIIKENTPIVTGNIPYEALPIIAEKASQMKAKLYAAEKMHPQFDNGLISLNNGAIKIKTHFVEALNKWNVASAWQITNILHSIFPVDEQKVMEAIETFAGAPARFEKLQSAFDWYFSGAHNLQALDSSLHSIKQLKPKRDSVLVFSAMKDKISEEWLARLSGFKEIYFVEQEGERAAKFYDIRNKIQADLMDETSKERILNELKSELVIFTGSFYFYPTVKRWTANVS